MVTAEKKTFIKSMLSEGGGEEYSSRRVVGFSAFILLMMLVITAVFFNIHRALNDKLIVTVVPSEMFQTIAYLVFGIFTLTTAQKGISLFAKKEVASSIAENNTGQEGIDGASGVMQADKPQ